MRFRLLLPILGLVACDGGQSGENVRADVTCAGITYEDVDPTDTSLGFSAEELVASLPPPAGVEWTSLSEDGTLSDTVSFTDLSVEGQVRIADLSAASPHCLPGQGIRLVVPLGFDAEIGDGEVVGHGTVDLWASSLDPADVLPISIEDPTRPSPGAWTFPVTLSGSYGDALDTWWAAEQAAHPEATDWRLEGVYLIPYDPWATLRLDLEVLHDSTNADSVSTLWRGPVTFEP